MRRLVIGLKLAALAAVFAFILPPHWLAVRYHWGMSRRIPVLFHRVALWVLDVRVRQVGNAPEGRPALVLSNHVSWLDIVVLGSLRPLSFVAKSEVATWPVFGLLARLQRSIFVDRTRKTATGDVNATIARRLARGELIVLFAEGTTSDGNRVLPFRAPLVGAARLALADHSLDRIDLQPLGITYTRRNGLPLTRSDRPKIAWYGDMDLLPHLGAFLMDGPADVEVRWGEPIPFDAATDRKQAALQAEAAVRHAIAARRGT